MITRGEDYAFARSSLTATKLRALELKAGMPARRGQTGTASGYSLKDVRARVNDRRNSPVAVARIPQAG
jgi:hypothetical protein